VYIGLDIWGRNCEWYGGFKIDVGLAKIASVCQASMSVGLFSIAWLYESLPPEDYVENSHKFWRIAAKHLNACSQITAADLPLKTRFHCGADGGVMNSSKQDMCAHVLCQPEGSADGENLLIADYNQSLGLHIEKYRSKSKIRYASCHVSINGVDYSAVTCRHRAASASIC